MRKVIIRGEPLLVQDNEALSNHIVRENDFYEAEVLDYIRDNFNDNKVIVDIGANLGNHTIYFSRYLKHSYIYSFEPIPQNFEVLIENMKYLPEVLVFPFALSDTFTTVNMTLNNENWGVGWVDPVGTIKVDSVPLDSLELENVTLIKIDVENFEPTVLKGAQETIKKNKPIILIEDNFNRYEELLPDYDKIKEWEIYRTYLYVPKG